MAANKEIKLSPTTVLQRADDLSVDVGVHGNITVSRDGRAVSAGSRGLALLDAFAQPTSVQTAVARLGATGSQDWIDLTGAIQRLIRAGILGVPGASRTRRGARGFGSAAAHVAMLNDRTRTRAYLDAIADTVRPGDVVVEIGTGTGIFSVAAARAGARRVYAIEMNGRVADVADEVFQANDVADRIVLVRGASTEIELPERGDVLISETLGNQILNERVLESFADATRRLLTAEAQRIPSSIRVLAIPFQVPDKHIDRAISSEGAHADWLDWYGVDLSPLGALLPNANRSFVARRPRDMGDWPRLGAPVEIADIATDGTASRSFDVSVPIEMTRDGTLNGVSLVFDAALTGAIRLTNSPVGSGDDCHWLVPTWPIMPAIAVARGDIVTFRIRSTGSGFSVAVAEETSPGPDRAAN